MGSLVQVLNLVGNEKKAIMIRQRTNESVAKTFNGNEKYCNFLQS